MAKMIIFKMHKRPSSLLGILPQPTVNLEIFTGNLFSRIALKDVFMILKNRDYGMICLISKRQSGFAISHGFY